MNTSNILASLCFKAMAISKAALLNLLLLWFNGDNEYYGYYDIVTLFERSFSIPWYTYLPDCEDNQLQVTGNCYGIQSQEQTEQKAGTMPVQFYKICWSVLWQMNLKQF